MTPTTTPSPDQDPRRRQAAPPGDDQQVIMAWATCPPDRADALASALVDERLAACVNITAPVTSVYRWQGEVARDDERLLIIKTTMARREAMASRLFELHPYDVPELLFVPVGGSAPYLEWVRTSVADADRS